MLETRILVQIQNWKQFCEVSLGPQRVGSSCYKHRRKKAQTAAVTKISRTFLHNLNEHSLS